MWFFPPTILGKACTGEFVTGSFVVIICLDVSRYKFSFCSRCKTIYTVGWLIDFAGYPWYNLFIICWFHVNNQVCWYELLKLIPHCLSKYFTIKNNGLLSIITLLIPFFFSFFLNQNSGLHFISVIVQIPEPRFVFIYFYHFLYSIDLCLCMFLFSFCFGILFGSISLLSQGRGSDTWFENALLY